MAVKTVAIIGGGPAGATLGALLGKKGYKVGIFHSDKRPPLIVGESLLPAVIPLLRTLGIEDEVKSFSVYKPGATVCLNLDEVISASFKIAEGRVPDYAYNTPRDLFDLTVLKAAENAGAKIFKTTAKLEKGDQPNTVRLCAGTLEETDGFFRDRPDLIIDASGRLRIISRLLDGVVHEGPRRDVALFAHLDKINLNDAGHIHLDRLTRGWCWRIPLPGRTSLGIVINPKHLEKYGTSVEQQFDAFLNDDPSLKVYAAGATRLTPVMKYNNYQLIPEKMHGPGWALIGDAAGFVDPVFSPGLFLSMKDGFDLFKAIETGLSHGMAKYEENRRRDLKMWQQVINSWYSGELFNLYRAGLKYEDNFIGRRMVHRVRRRIARILTGQAASDPFDMLVFKYLIRFGTVVRDPKDIAVV